MGLGVIPLVIADHQRILCKRIAGLRVGDQLQPASRRGRPDALSILITVRRHDHAVWFFGGCLAENGDLLRSVLFHFILCILRSFVRRVDHVFHRRSVVFRIAVVVIFRCLFGGAIAVYHLNSHVFLREIECIGVVGCFRLCCLFPCIMALPRLQVAVTDLLHLVSGGRLYLHCRSDGLFGVAGRDGHIAFFGIVSGVVDIDRISGGKQIFPGRFGGSFFCSREVFPEPAEEAAGNGSCNSGSLVRAAGEAGPRIVMISDPGSHIRIHVQLGVGSHVHVSAGGRDGSGKKSCRSILDHDVERHIGA